MKLSFFGADRTVTGSCHCLDAAGLRILMDCGLQQGAGEINNEELPFAPNGVDYVLVTHAHIDHSGRLPLLVKQGFQGKIYTTSMTAKLLSIMLRDSAHIQESDAEYANRKGKRAGRAAKEPLYTTEDAEKALTYIETCEYRQVMDLSPQVRVCFQDAGHLLGSASIEVWVTEEGVTKKLVFSGDIGNDDQPIICDPTYIHEADYVVMESTYGDRIREDNPDYMYDLAKIIDQTFARGGNVVIPSFAVGRTQELLYNMRQIKAMHLVKSAPDFAVYVDSPLARSATEIFSGDLTGYMDKDAIALVENGVSMLEFSNLHICETTEDSKALNTDPESKVIISASGMCDAGRIRHHLKHNLWRPECTVVFVGYQAQGSFGRMLLDGAKTVRLFGEEIAVKAQIVNFKGLSSHADREGLLRWIRAFDPVPAHVFVVHGDPDVAPAFAQDLRDMGIPAHAPEYLEVYDLALNLVETPGKTPERKKTSKETPAFQKLLDAGARLMAVIQRNRGGTNKDLGKFASQIDDLAGRWDRK